MPLAGRSTVVFGMARSGLASAHFLVAHGADVLVVDEAPEKSFASVQNSLSQSGFRILTGLRDWEQCGHPDLVVVSPGIPADHPYLTRARAEGAEVIGEIELAYRFCAAPIIAVTGTNGKGSTTTLLGEMLKAAGLKVQVAGNIGVPLISVVEQDLQVLVAEVSSFQLETVAQFHPWAGILLNITPDHLTRHGTLEAYVAAKQRLFARQTANDLAILNVDDPLVAVIAQHLPVSPLLVGLREGQAGYLRDEQLWVKLPDREAVAVCRVTDLPLPGAHYLTNTLCAAIVAVAAGCTPAQIQDGVRNWQPAAHQMETVATISGIRFIDDSKATNPASAIADLATVNGRVLVIAGGETKGLDMTPFADALAARAAGVFLIGEGAFEIAAGIAGRLAVSMCRDIGQAVREAFAAAEPGDTIILAPACASFDQFNGQADRGNQFAAAARALQS